MQKLTHPRGSDAFRLPSHAQFRRTGGLARCPRRRRITETLLIIVARAFFCPILLSRRECCEFIATRFPPHFWGVGGPNNNGFAGGSGTCAVHGGRRTAGGGRDRGAHEPDKSETASTALPLPWRAVGFGCLFPPEVFLWHVYSAQPAFVCVRLRGFSFPRLRTVGREEICWSRPHVVVVEGVPQRVLLLGHPAWDSRCPVSPAFGDSRTRLLCRLYFLCTLCTSDAFLRVLIVKVSKRDCTVCTFAAEHSRPSSEFDSAPGCNAGTCMHMGFLYRATHVPCTIR